MQCRPRFDTPEEAIAHANRRPPPKSLSFEEREKYACDVCGNVPNLDGLIEHGRGCYTQSENGGGTSFVEFAKPTPPPVPQAVPEGVMRDAEILEKYYSDLPGGNEARAYRLAAWVKAQGGKGNFGEPAKAAHAGGDGK